MKAGEGEMPMVMVALFSLKWGDNEEPQTSLYTFGWNILPHASPQVTGVG